MRTHARTHSLTHAPPVVRDLGRAGLQEGLCCRSATNQVKGLSAFIGSGVRLRSPSLAFEPARPAT